MMKDDTYLIEGGRPELAGLLRCKVEDFNNALPILKASGIADVALHSNGHVTILCRRRQRELQARENGRIRVSKHREKRKCNDTPPLASGSASDSSPKGLGERGKGFPVTIDDAIQQCVLVPVPKEFVMQCFSKADSRGGKDAKGIEIARFSSYVLIEWKYEQDRKGREKSENRGNYGNKRSNQKGPEPDHASGF
jgi:hypothetical protein